MSIREWLAAVGLAQYAEAFEAQDIGTELLAELDHGLLKELGVERLGHRLKILRAAKEGEKPADPAGQGQPVVDPIGQRPITAVSAERRQLTILFADFHGGTGLSATMDPEDFRDLIRRFHETVASIATQAGGHIAQFLGAGAMIYFGYPVAQEHAAERAVSMAIELIRAVAGIQAPDGTAPKLRIGVGTGTVVVGDFVGRGLDEGAVVSGETPNLAARLQSLSGPNEIIIGDNTYQLIGRAYDVEALSGRHLKGFEGEQKIWRVTGRAEIDDRFEALRATRTGPFVGRNGELAALLDSWKTVLGGQGRTVLVAGAAGSGKSRLIREFADRAQGAALLQVQCSSNFGSAALRPFRRSLSRLAGIQTHDLSGKVEKALSFFGLDRAHPTEDASLIAGFFGLPTEDLPRLTTAISDQRARLFDLVAARIIRLAAEQPLILLAEDVQWSDRTSLQLLETLVSKARDSRMMVAVTFRPAFEPPWSDVQRIDLTCLSDRDARELATGLVAPDTSDDVLSVLIDRADGVPLFIEELSAGTAANGRAENDVPVMLLDMLAARLDRPVAARSVAQIASVIGREFDEELLVAAAERPRREVRNALEMLESAELVCRGVRDGAWRFVHALVRDVARNSLVRRSRRDLHLRIARALEAAFPERVPENPGPGRAPLC